MTDEAVERTPINRREFLNLAWLASLGFIFVNFAGVTYLFAMPRFKEGEFGGKFTLGGANSLPGVDAPPENFPKAKFWLSNTDEGVTAIYKVCTHLGCLYNWNNQEAKFICPCHGSQFDLDGSFLAGPAPRDLDRFVIEAIDPDTEEVIAKTDENGDPLQIPEGKDVIIKVDTGAKINGKPRSS